MHYIKWNRIFICLLFFYLTACTSFSIDHTPPVRVPLRASLAILPFTNTTETPQAEERAEAMLADLLRSKGLYNIKVYPNQMTRATLIPGVKPSIPLKNSLAWANNQGARYAFTGNVTEWNYKVGLDGEPAIGLTIQMISVPTGEVIWSAVGSQSGGSRTALSTVAQNLMASMLTSIQGVKNAF